MSEFVPSLDEGDNTPAQKPYSKWKDKAFVNEYYRQKYRAQVMKTHPYKMDDGTLWSDTHPHGKYATKEEKLNDYKKYRNKAEKYFCDVCQKDVFVARRSIHDNSKAHISGMKSKQNGEA